MICVLLMKLCCFKWEKYQIWAYYNIYLGWKYKGAQLERGPQLEIIRYIRGMDEVNYYGLSLLHFVSIASFKLKGYYCI